MNRSIRVSFDLISAAVLQVSIISFVKFIFPFNKFIYSTIAWYFGGSSFTFLDSSFLKRGYPLGTKSSLLSGELWAAKALATLLVLIGSGLYSYCYGGALAPLGNWYPFYSNAL